MLVAWSAMRSRCRIAENSDRPGSTSAGELCMVWISSLDDLAVVAVHLVVQPAHGLGLPGVEVDEGIEALPDHRGRQVGHALKLLRNGHERRPRQVNGPLGDVLGQVAHALQVGVDLQGGGDAAQVDGHRLVQGQDLQALFLDVVFLLVDLRRRRR